MNYQSHLGTLGTSLTLRPPVHLPPQLTQAERDVINRKNDAIRAANAAKCRAAGGSWGSPRPVGRSMPKPPSCTMPKQAPIKIAPAPTISTGKLPLDQQNSLFTMLRTGEYSKKGILAAQSVFILSNAKATLHGWINRVDSAPLKALLKERIRDVDTEIAKRKAPAPTKPAGFAPVAVPSPVSMPRPTTRAGAPAAAPYPVKEPNKAVMGAMLAVPVILAAVFA